MRYKLGEIFNLQMGKTPDRHSPKFWNEGTEPWISIADLTKCIKYIENTAEKITATAVDESGIKIIPKNTVIMSFKLSIGKVAITPKEMYSNEAIMSFIDKGVLKIEPVYLYYLLMHKDWDTDTNKAVMGKTLNKATLSQMTVNIHGYSEQLEIIKALDTASSIITARKQQLAELDNLIKARFVEMFGDCVLNSKGWKTKRLGDIAEVGSSKRVFVEDLKESGIPFYRGTEIGALAEGKTVTPELFISKEHYAELCIATGAPNIGDLLMPSICPDGRIWVVNTEKPFYFKDGRVLWVHAIDDSYNPVFLLYTLKDRIMSDYSSIASGTTFAELKIFALKECHVFDVPLELQNQFAAFVNQTDKSKVAVQKVLDEAQLLFDSLMQKYFE